MFLILLKVKLFPNFSILSFIDLKRKFGKISPLTELQAILVNLCIPLILRISILGSEKSTLKGRTSYLTFKQFEQMTGIINNKIIVQFFILTEIEISGFF